MRVSPDGKTVEVIAVAPEPSGTEFDAQGNLIVADAKLGLISVDKAGRITVLTNEVDGTPIIFADDLAIDSEGHSGNVIIHGVGLFTFDDAGKD